MSKILYVNASPRGERSHAAAVAQAFLDAYRTLHPKDGVSTLEVFTASLPAFDGLAVRAKYAILHGKKPSSEERAAWKTVEAVIAEFKAAEKYVFAVPMWNFGIPYRLKQYLDLLIQPTYTFSHSAEGYQGLLTDRKAFVAYARGGDYPEGTPAEAYDFQKKYMDLALGFMGITNVQSVIVQPTLGGEDLCAKRQAEAIAKARSLAQTF